MGNRKRKRVKAVLPVRISGTDASGNPFTEFAHTLDIGCTGTRLGGFRGAVSVGSVVGVHFQHRRASFRVIWISRPGESEERQLGLECLETDRGLWGTHLPSELYVDDFDVPKPATPAVERVRHVVRYPVTGIVALRTANETAGHSMHLNDISLGGCYVQAASPLPAMTRVRLNIQTGGVEIDVFGVVRASHPRIGMGIEFVQFASPEDQERLHKLAATLEQRSVPLSSERSLEASFVSHRVTQATRDLLEIEELIRRSHVDGPILREFRDALGHVRATAWNLQRWLELEDRHQDPLPALTYLLRERVRVAIQLCNTLVRAPQNLDPHLLATDFDRLLESVEALFVALSTIKARAAAQDDDQADAAKSAS